MSTMLPLSYSIQDSVIFSYTTVLIKAYMYYCISVPACYYQFVCYTVLVGGHFPKKSNDDCLPSFLFESFFYGLLLLCYIVCVLAY